MHHGFLQVPCSSDIHCIPPKEVQVMQDTFSSFDHFNPASKMMVPNYVFQAGDSVAGLAEEFKVPVESILTANKYPNADSVHIGDGLYIITHKVRSHRT